MRGFVLQSWNLKANKKQNNRAQQIQKRAYFLGELYRSKMD